MTGAPRSTTMSEGIAAQHLNEAALHALPANVERPRYRRDRLAIGIVHIGVGAFHRAHQAVYLDELLAADPTWAISGVSLRSAAVRDALRPQDGLYTLVLLGAEPALRVVGSIRELLCARDERDAVLARLADPGVRLVTLTVTEKGYCLAGDALDLAHPEIAHDLASPDAPIGAVGTVVAGLRRRWRQGFAPYTVLSCDNLADNGGRLRRAVLQFADATEPVLARWIEANVSFPRSMVDSITPASDDALRTLVATGLGCVDAAPVQRERYTQWVVEDRFCNGRPDLPRAGVTLSDDIAGHDRAKLRLLNGPHSTLAYVGSLLGIETVVEAMREPLLAGLIERLMREDIAPTLAVPRGFDSDSYIDAILERFRNPAIRHLLSQIAWDGSQKLPVRLFGTIDDALAAGRPVDRLCLPVAAWMRFVRRQARNGVALIDPLADRLAAIGRATSGEADMDVDAFLKLEAVFGTLPSDARVRVALQRAYAALGDATPGAMSRALRTTIGS